MASFFFNKNFSEIQEFTGETARYLGYKKSNPPDEKISELIEKSAGKMKEVLLPQAVWSEYELEITENNTIKFADISFSSRDLCRNLKNCSKIIIFAATIGPKVDQMIRRAQQTGSTESAIMQATGAMFIESFVDLLNDELKEKALDSGLKAHPRYSPGYGDVPLSFQKEFFRLLPCSKIGLTLMDSLIMAPEKSVTAFIGLEKL